MRFRRNKNSHVPWRITLWSVVAFAVALGILNQSPLPVDVDFPAEEPVELTREAPADVVVVIDWAAIRSSPNTFSKRDFSAAWINTLEQEVGPVTIATPNTLNAKVLDEARIIILTASVAKNVPPAITKTLRDLALAGRLLVVVERPQGELRERFAANGKVGPQRAKKISWLRDVEDPTRQHLTDATVDIEFIGSTTPKEGATTWMSVDGAPVVYSTPVGQGHVVIVDFDFGEFLVATQQGRPQEDFTLKANPPTTTELATLPAGQRFPIADAVERFLVHGVFSRLMPLPVFWPFPAGAEGVVLGSRTDHVLGNGGAWMLRYEASRKASSTLLSTVDSGFNTEGRDKVEKMGGEVGLLWRMQGTSAAAMESFGIGPLQPFARPVTLEAQVAAFESQTGGKPISGATFDQLWSRDWATPLQAFSSQGIRLDLSYTPGPQAGYRFGTGLPFLAMDESGLPLSIREVPIVVPHQRSGGPELVDLLQDSHDFAHQAIAVADVPAAFADFPDIARFEDWVQMFDHAETFAHPIMSAIAFDIFARARRASSVRTRTLTQPRDDGGESLILRVTVEAKRPDLELVLPERVGNRAFSAARQKVNRVGEELVSGELEASNSNYSGVQVRRIKLESGFNTIDAFYEVAP